MSTPQHFDIAPLTGEYLSIGWLEGDTITKRKDQEPPGTKRSFRTALGLAAALLLCAGLVFALVAGTQAATITVPAGSNWYCDSSYEGSVCETTINAGDSVTWEMVQGTHTVTECDDTFSNCPPAGGGFDSGILNTGETFSRTFTEPGTSEYLCTLHEAQMRGRVIVQASTPSPTPDGSSTPTPTPPGTPSPTPSPPAPSPGYVFPELLLTGKSQATGLAMIPGTDSEAVLITQDGDLWKVDLADPAQAPAPFGSVRDRMTKSGDEGLLGITFEPGDPTRLYINYTRGTEYYRPYSTAPQFPPSTSVPEDPKRSRIARFAIVDGVMDMDSEETVFESLRPGDWHTVNDIVFGPDGYLYAGSGDGGWIEASFDSDGGQGVGNQLATILRIDPNNNGPGYTIPPDNPFADGAGPNADEVWAFGTRNPWRISFDSLTGELWGADVGQWLWEEVNRYVAGGNYGWSVMEGTDCHFGEPCSPAPEHLPPRTQYCNRYNSGPCEYTDECAIIGGYVYRGADIPDLDGWYVYADFCSGRLRAVDTSSPSSPAVLLGESGLNPVSFTEAPDGELLIVDYSGSIHQLAFDSDGDALGDPFDNCPSWTNPSQTLPNWPIPAGDADCDGFPDSVAQTLLAPETYIGTDPTRQCASNSSTNDESGADKWPMDFNDNRLANGQDFLTFIYSFAQPIPGDPITVPAMGVFPRERWDFTGNGIINGQDFLKYINFFAKTCSLGGS